MILVELNLSIFVVLWEEALGKRISWLLPMNLASRFVLERIRIA